jgi:hypothetical protein
MRNHLLAALLSFTGGFVDTAGFLGLQGLFTAHVTGNFVTLGATLVLGAHGAIAKLLALPEFVLVVALVSIAADWLARRHWPAVPLLLSAKVALLVAFFALAVALGPFPDSDAPAALVTGFAGVAAMGVQNAVQRMHLAMPPAGHADDRQHHPGGARRRCARSRRKFRPGCGSPQPLQPHVRGDRLVCCRLRARRHALRVGRILVPRSSRADRRGERRAGCEALVSVGRCSEFRDF